MKKGFRVFCRVASVIAVATVTTTSAWAVPFLQLGIENGTYDPVNQDVVNTSNPFTLYGLLNPGGDNGGGSLPANWATRSYYLSAAVVPRIQDPGFSGFGSFSINGTEYSFGNGMTYGTPPVASAEKADDNLPTHEVFPTHFVEIDFTFNPDNKANVYNVQDNPDGFVASPTGTMLYESFNVDINGLTAGYYVHFDLYTYDTLTGKKASNPIKIDLAAFAPFSHDAQGGKVPDAGSSALLLGMGCLWIVEQRRRRIPSH